jgi:hypothetical protein
MGGFECLTDTFRNVQGFIDQNRPSLEALSQRFSSD